ncbi:MAG: NDP-hexose-3-ketoreductase [Cytophagaceae bacterium BCCC1]|nr:MAG: NDP-hexose-3-ketoreductase [Cytophagaceae bacterium BCCC1]
MTNKVKIGVLGCANIAKRSVIPAILELPHLFELIYVASRDIEKSKSFAEEFGCKYLGSYEELISSPDIQALYVPLPTGIHYEWIIKALDAGKHVYAEKSFASNYNEACEMVELAKTKNLAIMEGFMFQYHRQHQKVFELLRNNKIGEIRHFSATFCFPPLEKGNFRYDEVIGGGALLDAAGYTVRACHFIMGNNFELKASSLYIDKSLGTNIYGSAYLVNPETKIGAALAFGFDNFYQSRYEIIGQKGKITAERAFTPRKDFSPKLILENEGTIEEIFIEPDNHFVNAFKEFYTEIFSDIKKEHHYHDILLQSKTLEQIKTKENQ